MLEDTSPRPSPLDPNEIEGATSIVTSRHMIARHDSVFDCPNHVVQIALLSNSYLIISAKISSALQLATKQYKGDRQRTFQLLFGQRIFVLVKVEELLGDGFCGWLVFWVMIWLQIRVPQCLFHRDSFDRIESEKLL